MSVTIRNVPDAARAKLAQRAGAAGQSLQEYLRLLLIDTAATPTIDEWLDEARASAGGSGVRLSADEYVAAVHTGRSGTD